jgi:hypothetical protein
MSILDDVKSEVQNMDADAVKAELARLLTQRAKRTEAQKERNSNPDVQAKRQAYSKQYREKAMSDPEKAAKIVERRKAYMSKPEVKARMKTYRDKRNAKVKEILARAKELGIEVPSGATA